MKRVPTAGSKLVLVTLLFVASSVAATPRDGNDGSEWPIDPETAPRPVARASRTSDRIVIDGRLEEEAWRKVEPITQFIQSIPDAGYPATERTEVRILYDDKNLYVGAICYDSKPDQLVVKTLEREFPGLSSHEMDMFNVYLDTFLDRKNGFMWLINPQGAYRDGQSFDDSRNLDFGWDGVADIKTEVGDYGWTVEMAVPWTTLRFDPTRDQQVWGANFMRRVRRRNEESFWAPLDRRDRGHRMSKAGTLEGLPTAEPGRNLMLTPFVVAESGSGSAVPEEDTGGSFDGGFDLKYGVTPRMTADLTYRTDFSEVEVDQERVNLTRFPLFFPEKRDFFLENSGTFQFGDVAERSYRSGSSLRDFTLFHSRRIGLIGGRPVPIVGGGRLTGHAGPFELGLLDVQTQAFGETPPENFAVFRTRRAIRRDSDVGLMFGNRQATDGSGRYNRSFGVDANVKLLENMVVNSYFALTQEPGLVGDNKAARVQVGWRDRLWDIGGFYRHIGDGFNPAIGFVRRRNIRHTYATFGAHPRPRIPFVLEINPYVEGHYITDLKDVLQTRTGTLGFEVSFRDGGVLSLLYNDNFERLDEPFEILPGAVVPVGSYDFRDTSLQYTSTPARSVSGTVELAKGGYFDGSRSTIGGNIVWEPSYHLSFNLSASRNDFTLRDGSFSANVYGAQVKYAYSTKLYFGAYIQYNAATGQYVTNLRMNWVHAPLSDLFVVYNERRDASGFLQERYFTVKLTKLFQF